MQAAVGLPGGHLFGVQAGEDAAGQPAQCLGGLVVVGATDVVQDSAARALGDRIPGVVGELEVGEGGAVLAALARDAQVHVISI